jgi:hypothetical protein
MTKKFKKAYLKDNEKLIIPKEVKTFYMGCCNCGLFHKITINRNKKGEIILKFKQAK